MIKKYLISGATSMLGSETVNQLSKNNFIYAIVRKNSPNINNIKMNKNIQLIECDMQDYKSIIFDIDKIDGVIHFAWEGVRNPYRNDENIQRKNYEYSIDFYNNVKKFKPEFFIGIGSQGEYGNYLIPYNEKLECKPETWYGKYKNMFYQFLEENCKYDGIRLLWTRVFSAYGPKDYKKSLLMSSIEKMLNNEEVDMSPCLHIWSFTYYKDVIKAILLLIEKNCSGVYNVSNSDNIPLKDYIIKLKEILNSNSKLNFGYYKYTNGIIPNMIVDNGKLVEDTGYIPNYSFETGVKEILEELKNDN